MDKQIDVNTASRNELYAYARQQLGLDVDVSMNKAALIELIGKQTGQKPAASGALGEAAGMAEAGKEVEKNLKVFKAQKKVRIRIFENKDHPKRIQVSVNGVLYTMKPGVWVDVPESVVEVLRNAEQTSYSQHEDERGKLVTVPHVSLQYPFEISPASL